MKRWVLSLLWLSCLAVSAMAGEYEVELGVVYGKGGERELKADLYIPEGLTAEKRVPGILVVHGGGWTQGSRAGAVEVALGQRLAREGMVAMSIEYRLIRDSADGTSIENQWPAAIDDCRQAVRWLRENAERLHVDPERLGAIGGSAGGHLVSLLGTTDVAQPGEVSTRVQAVVDVFGPADLTGDYSHLPLGENATVQDLIDRFVGKGNTKNQRAASPIFHIDDQSAAFLIFHGTDDRIVPVDQSRRFHQALKEAGRPVEYVEYEGEGHGLAPANLHDALNRTVKFFKTTLAR